MSVCHGAGTEFVDKRAGVLSVGLTHAKQLRSVTWGGSLRDVVSVTADGLNC